MGLGRYGWVRKSGFEEGNVSGNLANQSYWRGRRIGYELFHTCDWADFLPHSHVTDTFPSIPLQHLPEPDPVTLQMEPVCSPEMSENTPTTKLRNPEEHQPGISLLLKVPIH